MAGRTTTPDRQPRQERIADVIALATVIFFRYGMKNNVRESLWDP